MVSKKLILGKLSPFLNKQNVVVENQDVTDIISGILKTQKKYESEYDNIYSYFIGDDLEETCRNIFDFLKANVPYYIESDNMQYLKSPSSIVSTKSDCKSYALFSCGILSAWERNEHPNIDVNYRFASYDAFDKTPQHVFCVVRQGDEEFWIDPVLDKFNQRKQPYSYKDKNVNKMALVGLSGVGSHYDNKKMAGIDWNNILDSVIKTTPSIIDATRGGSNQPYQYTPPYTQPTQSTGISTTTLLALGGVALVAVLLLRK